MKALINAATRRGGKEPPHTGFTSRVIPEATGSPRGVSVEYARDTDVQWFVLRVSYGRAMKAGEHLAKLSMHYYLPIHKVSKHTLQFIFRYIAIYVNILFSNC